MTLWERKSSIPVCPWLALFTFVALLLEESQDERIADPVYDHFDLLDEQAVISILDRRQQRWLGIFRLEPFKDEMRLIDGGSPVVED